MIEKEHFNLAKKRHDTILINVKNGGFLIFDSSAPADGIEDEFLARRFERRIVRMRKCCIQC